MITRADLLSAIAECHGERNPNANTCIKLAAYYTILEQMEKPEVPAGYSTKDGSNKIQYASGTDFSIAIDGKDMRAVLETIDEIMDTLAVINPRLYECAMRRLNGVS